MLGFLASLRTRGEEAVRAAVLFAVAGGFVVLATGFAAAAGVLLLAQQMPLWGALLCVAGALLLAACAALALASRKPKPTPPGAPGAAALLGIAASSTSLRDLVLRLAEHEARSNPATAAAIAAAAGLILGAIDGRAHGEGGADGKDA